MQRPTRSSQVCTLLLTSASRCRLYGVEHRLFRQALEELYGYLRFELAEDSTLRIAVSGDELIYRQDRLNATKGPPYGLLRRLDDRGIGFLEFQAGLTLTELQDFCVALADASPTSVRASRHLKVGTANLDPRTNPVENPEALRVQDLSGSRDDPVAEEATLLRELSHRLSQDYAVQTIDFKEIVLSLLSHMAHEGNIFLNLAEVRDHNLFTYLHTCNVATLSMGFGLALGISGEAAYDLGTAALLHDVGKNFIPREILDKPGPLTPEEWKTVQEHPQRGAEVLMRQANVNHLAVTAAYEHHMHHDGVGGYPKTEYAPCLQSQLIAVADTFDALFGRRSYHAKFEVLDAIEILQLNSGTMYHPQLVDEFSRFMTANIERHEWIGSTDPTAQS